MNSHFYYFRYFPRNYCGLIRLIRVLMSPVGAPLICEVFIMGNQYTELRHLNDLCRPVPEHIRDSIRNAKIRGKRRSDIGKRHKKKTSFVSDAFSFEDLECTMREIAYWEQWEERKIQRKVKERNRQRRIRDSIRREGGDPCKSKTLQEAVDTLSYRLSIIPSDMICPQCEQYKPKNKQWVVDFVNKTAICKVCHELNKRK